MADVFKDFGSPEWDAQRDVFYRGLMGEVGGLSGFDPLGLALGDIGWQGDAAALDAALKALHGRIHAAHDLAAAMLNIADPARERVTEGISDCALVVAHIRDLLAAHGPAGDFMIQFVRRGAGRPADIEKLRRKFTVVAELEHRAAAEKKESIVSDITDREGISRATLFDWQAEVAKWKKYHADVIGIAGEVD